MMRWIWFVIVLCCAATAPGVIQSEDTDTGHKTVVCLDPGHPSGPGDKPCESMINRKVAFLLEDCLSKKGYEVVKTAQDVSRKQLFKRNYDCEGPEWASMLEAMSPEDRAKRCNEQKADFAISIHHNYSYDRAVNHTTVLYGETDRYSLRFEDAPRWARKTAAALEQTMKVTHSVAASDQYIVGGSLVFLRTLDMIGILTEASFYSNLKERKRLDKKKYLAAEARAICDAFAQFRADQGAEHRISTSE